MINSTRSRLIFGFLAVAVLSGSPSIVVGGRPINTGVENEAITRVRQDLNAAREIYTSRRNAISLSLRLAAVSADMITAAARGVEAEILTWIGFLWRNLLPVTLGNLIGGGVFVGMSYWGAYLCGSTATT
jgi:hypothetical protein